MPRRTKNTVLLVIAGVTVPEGRRRLAGTCVGQRVSYLQVKAAGPRGMHTCLVLVSGAWASRLADRRSVRAAKENPSQIIEGRETGT